MNHSVFISGLAVSLIYLVRFEMKLLTRKKFQILFRHTLIVYIGVVLGFLLLSQFGEKIIKKFTSRFYRFSWILNLIILYNEWNYR